MLIPWKLKHFTEIEYEIGYYYYYYITLSVMQLQVETMNSSQPSSQAIA